MPEAAVQVPSPVPHDRPDLAHPLLVPPARCRCEPFCVQAVVLLDEDLDDIANDRVPEAELAGKQWIEGRPMPSEHRTHPRCPLRCDELHFREGRCGHLAPQI